MAETKRRQWYLLDDRSVAIIGTFLMTLSFVLMVIAFFGPVWIDKMVSDAPRSPKVELSNVTGPVNHSTTAVMDHVSSPNVTDQSTSVAISKVTDTVIPSTTTVMDHVTSPNATNQFTAGPQVAHVVENLWYICNERDGCISREESSHKGKLK